MTDLHSALNSVNEQELLEHISNIRPSLNNHQISQIQDAITRIQKLFTSKNAEYGDTGDVLANFRRLAAQQGVPMSTAWFFLVGKHLDTISQYVKDTREGTNRQRTQAVSERIDDMIVYGLLLLVIVSEEN